MMRNDEHLLQYMMVVVITDFGWWIKEFTTGFSIQPGQRDKLVTDNLIWFIVASHNK